VRPAIAIAFVIGLVLARPAAATPLLTLPGGDRIEVRYEPGLEDTARQLRDGADAALARIAGDLDDLPQPRAIHVQIVRDAASLPDVAPGGRGAPAWAIGVAYPDLGVISVATRRGSQVVDAMSTLRHELAHLALGAALGNRAPHWLHEGFAYQHSAEWSWDRTETLAGMAWFGGIVPIDDLDQAFPAEELPAHRAYAESYDFVGYLSRRGRYEDTKDDGDRFPFQRFLSAIGHGDDLDTAAVRAYGRPLHLLFDEWRETLSQRYLLAPVGLIGLAVWILCALLLGLAWWRRRRQNRRRLAQWENDDRWRDEQAARAQAETEQRARPVIVPPYVAWPGDDPLAEDDDDDEPPPDKPRQMN
jgi:hypothetical protein